MSPQFSAVYGAILLILAAEVAGNEDMYKSLDEFQFWPDPTTTMELAALESKNRCCHFFSVSINQIHF